MIKANELRIGNLITRLFEGSSPEVEAVTVRTIFDCQMGDSGKFTFEGIPLTEEWLVKFGFVPSNSNYRAFWKKMGSLTLEARINSNHVYFEILGSLYLDRIRYVHQLQNAWHSLTGHELTLSE